MRAPLTLAVALLAPLLAAACDANVLEVVHPGGVDAACAGENGGGMNCPTGAQYVFDGDNQGFVFGDNTTNARDLRNSCRYTFCGGGALAYHADWVYSATVEDRLTDVHRPLDPPVDMTNKVIFAHVLVDDQSTPMNAQIAIFTENRYWLVKINILERGWNYISEDLSLVTPPIPSLNAVTNIIFTAYLATHATWSGDVYVDELGWR